MKTAVLLLALALLASGCNLAPKTTEAASTKLSTGTPMGRTSSLELPKNLKAEDLHVEYNPQAGTFVFKAKKLETDASTVIDSAGAVQAQAVSTLAETLSTIVPLIVPAAK